MTNSRQIALEYIQALNEKDLVDFFYEAIEKFNSDREFEDGFERDRFVLAQTNYGAIKNIEDEQFTVEFTALPTPSHADIDWVRARAVIVESGGCDRCQATVTSAAKLANCPICDSEVECT